jgi:FixJ family two-component response regulator
MAPVVTGRLVKKIAGGVDLRTFAVKLHRGQTMRKLSATSAIDWAL